MAIPNGTIIKNPFVKLFNPASGVLYLDASGYVTQAELGQESEQIDLKTMAQPMASGVGNTEATGTLTLLGNKTFLGLLSAYVDSDVVIAIGSASHYYEANVRIPAINVGTVAHGQRIEISQPLFVQTEWSLKGS